jgi:hypothetical protein
MYGDGDDRKVDKPVLTLSDCGHLGICSIYLVQVFVHLSFLNVVPTRG